MPRKSRIERAHELRIHGAQAIEKARLDPAQELIANILLSIEVYYLENGRRLTWLDVLSEGRPSIG